MSIFVSNSDKRGIRIDVFRQAFKGMDSPDFIVPLVKIIDYIEKHNDTIPLLYAEHGVTELVPKLKGGGYGSIPEINVWSAARLIYGDVWSNNRDALQTDLLTNGLFWSYRFGNIPIKMPMPLKMAQGVAASGKAMGYFEKYGIGKIVTQLLNLCSLVDELKKSSPETEARKKAIQTVETMLSGDAEKNALLAFASAIPILSGISVVAGIVALFGGAEKQKVAEKAAKDASVIGDQWTGLLKTLSTLPMSPSVTTETTNAIISRARLYSPADLYGNSLESLLGLPMMASVYGAVAGMSVAVPPIIQQSDSPVDIDLSLTPLPGADPAEVVGQTTETRPGPGGLTTTIERPVTQAEADVQQEAAASSVDAVLDAPAPGITETQKQYLTAGAIVAGLFTKGFGFATEILKRRK